MKLAFLFLLLPLSASAEGLQTLSACQSAAKIPKVQQLDAKATEIPRHTSDMARRITATKQACEAERNQADASRQMERIYRGSGLNQGIAQLNTLKRQVDQLVNNFQDGMNDLQEPGCGAAGAKVKTDLDTLIRDVTTEMKSVEQACRQGQLTT